jgi:hypothetical protein
VLCAVLLQSKALLAGGEKGLKLLASWTEDNEMCGDNSGQYAFYGVVCDNDLVYAM